MTLKVKIIILVILFVFLAVIINMVRRRELDLKYVLTWMFCDAALIVLICFPRLMNLIARIFGVYDPVNMVFFLGFLFSLIIIFSLTVTISKVTGKVRRMAQIISMLPEEVIEDAIKRYENGQPGEEPKQKKHTGVKGKGGYHGKQKARIGS